MTASAEHWSVHPGALRKEGDLWEAQSAVMEKISDDGDVLRFDSPEGGLLTFMYVPSYHKMVDMIVNRCAEARERMLEIKDRLNLLATGYEATEAQNIHNILHSAQP
jgi:hypothetical protein